LSIKRIIRAPLLLALLSALLFSAPVRAEGEQQAIEGFNATLLGTMQAGPELGFQGRYDRLAEPLQALFDFQTMVQIGLQRHWATIPETDRAAIVDAFTRMSVATYASRFDAWNGERFSIEGVRPGPRGLVLVSSLIHRTDKDPVNLTYVMRSGTDGPPVIDILAQGRFSELARQRAEMTSIFARSGAEGLIASLDEKAREFAAE